MAEQQHSAAQGAPDRPAGVAPRGTFVGTVLAIMSLLLSYVGIVQLMS